MTKFSLSFFLLSLSLIILPTSKALTTTPPHSTTRIIVKFVKDKIPDKFTDKKGLTFRKLFPHVYSASGVNIQQIELILKNHKGVEYVEKDFKGNKHKFKNINPIYPQSNFSEPIISSFFKDPMANKQWHLHSAKKFGSSIEEAYKKRVDDKKEEIIVAVVDTGIDYRHEDLMDNLWKNSGEIPNNQKDDDGNGYIDDYYGINTLVRDKNGKATSDPMDKHGHGTHVAGIIGAKQNNGKGVAGISEKIKLMGIRTVPGRGDEKDVDVIEAFIYAAKNGAKIINCSFGKNHNEGGKAVSEAIDYIFKEYGVLVIAASGNSRRNIDKRSVYPASFTNENLLVVASSSKGSYLSYFSNFGTKSVDLAAPGSNILSTYPGNRYVNLSGTSMASPVAAGVAAELLSRNNRLDGKEIKEILIKSISVVDSFKGKIFAPGRVDLENSLKYQE